MEGLLPRSLRGVPDSLQGWWSRADPADLEKLTLRSGRSDVLVTLARRLAGAEKVLDLGCGPGLLAREARRRDIVGVDMAARMVDVASQHMDLVIADNILEHFPSERFHAVVLCNVLEPYPQDMWHLLFRHCHEFLLPGGRLYVVVSLAGAAEGCLDLVFPSPATGSGGALSPEEVEQALMLACFDLDCVEILEARTSTQVSVLPGEEPKLERRSFALLTGIRPREEGT